MILISLSYQLYGGIISSNLIIFSGSQKPVRGVARVVKVVEAEAKLVLAEGIQVAQLEIVMPKSVLKKMEKELCGWCSSRT